MCESEGGSDVEESDKQAGDEGQRALSLSGPSNLEWREDTDTCIVVRQRVDGPLPELAPLAPIDDWNFPLGTELPVYHGSYTQTSQPPSFNLQ